MANGKVDYKKLLAGSPFKMDDDDDGEPQHIVLAYSQTGHGKTTFSLDAPGPIGYIDIDYRAKWAIKLAKERGKVIFHHSVRSVQKTSAKDDATIMREARESWDLAVKAINWCCDQRSKGNVATVVLDTASELYQLNLFKLFGRTDKIMKRDYGTPRHEFRALTKMLRQAGLNVVLLCHQKEEYRNDVPTGRMIWAGFDDMGSDVDTAVQLKMVNKKFPGDVEKRTRFEMSVVKAGVNASFVYGNDYTSDEWDEIGVGPFTYLSMQVFPDTTAEDWGAETAE